ncbi:MAG: hypothetical protein H6Q68_3592 [Firmicutes bacterium]|nr:hypothetical protein [Bacillota bacterium]
MPVNLFTIFTGILLLEIGSTFQWFVVKETAFPFQNFSNLYSLDPIIAMWLMKFLYGNFGLYLGVNVIMNVVFVYGALDYFYQSRGIFQFIGITPFLSFLIVTVRVILLYGYQMWQEGIFAKSERTSFSMNLQPAISKPLQDKKENNSQNDSKCGR